MNLFKKKNAAAKASSEFVCNVRLDRSEIKRLFIWIFPSLLIPLLLYSFFDRDGLTVLETVFVSLGTSLFAAFFLFFLAVVDDYTKIYKGGIVVYDSSRRCLVSMGWHNMVKVRSESMSGFQVIAIKGRDGRVIKMMQNIKDKEAVAQTIKDLAGPDNPLYLFLREELLKSKG
ncbi:hypothetical protein [Desulfatibacillum aliphaticivorans]|uniref:hypothetical protein n=1 Tax=Desulfatibacillum aliphaticivorans TaxID=218208 RepID=UPI00042743EA|nr:hypothetical protein [Desulfatibacillum aliphaticivorans]